MKTTIKANFWAAVSVDIAYLDSINGAAITLIVDQGIDSAVAELTIEQAESLIQALQQKVKEIKK